MPETLLAGIVLVYVAFVPLPITSTVIVQMPATLPTWAGIVPPLNEIACVPAAAVTVPLPQVVLAFGAGAMTTPLVRLPGRVSDMDTLSN